MISQFLQVSWGYICKTGAACFAASPAARLGALSLVCASGLLGLLSQPVSAQDRAGTLSDQARLADRPHLSFFGTPGLMDMPTAGAMADADLALSAAYFGPTTRTNLAFQVSPRLTAAFRYVRTDRGPGRRDDFDRSFDLIYQIAREGTYRPAVAVGIRDFGGTGLQSAEYLAATKSFSGPRLGNVQVTAGLGWGRLASQGGQRNPLGVFSSAFETRPAADFGQGGSFEFDQLFRGDVAAFGGLAWSPNDRWTMMLEYSSDAYSRAVDDNVLDRRSSVNVGTSYKLSEAADVGLYYMYGSELGFRINYVLNPKVPPAASGVEPGPQPVMVRPARAAAPGLWDTAWVANPQTQGVLETAVLGVLSPEGLALEDLTVTATSARVALRNQRFGQSAQAVGRAARALTRALPPSVETFVIVLVEQGMPTTQVTIQRSDLEELEFAPDNAWQSYVRARIEDAGDQRNARRSIAAPKLTFSVTGYFNPSLFDPNEPVLYDAGLRFGARYEPLPGWALQASLRQPLVSNRDNTNRVSNSVLPFVRSEEDDYNRGNDPKLDELTLAHYFRPGRNLYGRVTAGYLETAFAGVSGEILWKPQGSRLALGVELNAVHQRQPGALFELGEGVYDNDAITGHASAYYDFENGFRAQVDVGRYLAEDWGGTFTLAREFDNGWEVGAYATFTDVSFDDFGEGSFDKGIFITIPLSWTLGQPSRAARTSVIQPILRDGGARVEVSDRLYDLVRQDSDPQLGDSWGRFWR
ncbi:YjbH domain-containing protein [Shimia ponticola]|uniref:YjbH domain-containing protein n=1 Tax=Shimia ponticola TaxID=2582893 RepID=UPI00164CC32E|nr:YjbH domain-containing protein [Shimia ponticola]